MSARRLPRPRLTYANVASSLALFIALGGTSYAVTKLPKNSVGTPQLRAGAVTLDKLATGVAISGPRGPRGEAGPQGIVGPQGATGNTGPANILTTSAGGIQLPAGTGQVVANSITVPAGNWWLIATGTFVDEANPVASQYFNCTLPAGNGLAGAVVRIGTEALAVQAGVYAIQGYVQLTAATKLEVKCGHDGTIAGNPRVDGAQFTAIRTDDLQVR